MHVYWFVYLLADMTIIPSSSTCWTYSSIDHGTCMWLKCLKFFKSIPTPKAPVAKNNYELGCFHTEGILWSASTILSFSLSGHWAWNCENNLCIDYFPHSSLMFRIECKYCLISTSYLVGLFDIFILLQIWQNCVLWWLYQWWHFVMLIMKNLNLISIQFWTYLTQLLKLKRITRWNCFQVTKNNCNCDLNFFL